VFPVNKFKTNYERIMNKTKQNFNRTINVIFDVDGTLWDSAEEVSNAWSSVLLKHPELGSLRITAEDMYRYMGHTMEEIALMMLPDAGEKQRKEVMEECMEVENTWLTTHSGRFYPALAGTLDRLLTMGCRLYIVSNCQDGYIQAMLTCGDLTSKISDFECFGRTNLQKGDNILLLMKRQGIDPETAVYVGDTAMDEKAAKHAGIRFIHAKYGFGKADAPDASISAIQELPEILSKMFPDF
jgi:phosphoglycolate phosphatase